MDPVVPLTEYKVCFCTNWFVNIPIIVQFDETPLLQFVPSVEATPESVCQIFSENGDDLGRLKGKRLFLTEDGEKAGVTIRHLDGVDVLEKGKQTLCELRKPNPYELHPTIELYSPTGTLLTGAPDQVAQAIMPDGQTPLLKGSFVLVANTFVGGRVGLHIRSDGRFSIGGLVKDE